MLSSRHVVTLLFALFMVLVGACADTRTSAELVDDIYASAKKRLGEQIAAGEGDYMAPLYESFGAGNYDVTIKQCEEYRELRPNDPVIYVLEGSAYYYKGEFSTAVSKLSSAIAIDSAQWVAYYYRSGSYANLKEPRKALEDLNTLVGSNTAPAQMVKFYDKLGEHKEHQTEDFMSANVLSLRAVYLNYLGETAAAIASMDRAISYDPSNSNLYVSRAEYHSSQQQYDLAYSDAEKAIELTPANFQAWGSAGVISLKLGNYSKAIMQFKKVSELAPDNAISLSNLGLAYWFQGEQIMAFEAMGQALRGDPTDSTYYHTAYFHHLSGRQDKALEYFKESYEINHDVLENRSFIMNSTPATSPTRKFYSDELEVAKQYITTGSTPTENAYKNRPPTLQISSVTLDPDPVKVNTPFDFRVSYKLDAPNSSENSLATVLKFTILRGSKTLFSSQPIHIDADNGGNTKWALHMNPVPKKGTYTIEVVVECQGLISRKNIELRIN